MADVAGEHIMALELAVQRELAYRRKVARLQSQSYANFCKDLIPMEVQSSSPNNSPRPNSTPSPELSGRGWQTPISNLEYLSYRQPHEHTFCKVQSSSPNPTQSPRLSGIKRQPPPTNSLDFQLPLRLHELQPQIDYTFCKICQVTCPSLPCYRQHIKGKKHLLNLRELQLGKKICSNHSEVGNQRRWCGLCKIWCMNENSLMDHLRGRKHMDELVKLELARTGGGEIAKQQCWCKICNMGCMNEHLLKMHFNGQRHKAELQKLENARKGGSEKAKQRYRCQLCNIWCGDKESLNMHFQGKKHVLRLCEIEKNRAQ